MNIRNGYNVLSVLLIIIMISFLLLGCDVYKSKESKEYINEIKQLMTLPQSLVQFLS